MAQCIKSLLERFAPGKDDNMLLQTNSYVVHKDRRAEHTRLLRRFRQVMARLGCEHFEVYEQTGPNWTGSESTGRFVHIMRFRDKKQQLMVQEAERADPAAQQLIAEFCELINFPFQQQQGLFASGFYTSVLPVGPMVGGPVDLPNGQPDTQAAARREAHAQADPMHAETDRDDIVVDDLESSDTEDGDAHDSQVMPELAPDEMDIVPEDLREPPHAQGTPHGKGSSHANRRNA